MAVARVRTLIAPKPGWVPSKDGSSDSASSHAGHGRADDQFDDESDALEQGSDEIDSSTVDYEVASVGEASRWRTGRARLDPGRRSTAAFVVTAVLSAALAVGVTLLSRPTAEPVNASPPRSVVAVTAEVAAQTSTQAASTAPAEIVVSVIGKVAKPGLVSLPLGARVSDALAACGGALPDTDLSSLNLAQKLSDGQQIAVGIPGGTIIGGDPATSGGAAGAAGPDAGTPINLNTATAAQLEELPGIGPVLAQRIVDFRTANGPFATVADLGDVPGVGPAIMGNVSSLVTV